MKLLYTRSSNHPKVVRASWSDAEQLGEVGSGELSSHGIAAPLVSIPRIFYRPFHFQVAFWVHWGQVELNTCVTPRKRKISALHTPLWKGYYFRPLLQLRLDMKKETQQWNRKKITFSQAPVYCIRLYTQLSSRKQHLRHTLQENYKLITSRVHENFLQRKQYYK